MWVCPVAINLSSEWSTKQNMKGKINHDIIHGVFGVSSINGSVTGIHCIVRQQKNWSFDVMQIFREFLLMTVIRETPNAFRTKLNLATVRSNSFPYNTYFAISYERDVQILLNFASQLFQHWLAKNSENLLPMKRNKKPLTIIQVVDYLNSTWKESRMTIENRNCMSTI